MPLEHENTGARKKCAYDRSENLFQLHLAQRVQPALSRKAMSAFCLYSLKSLLKEVCNKKRGKSF